MERLVLPLMRFERGRLFMNRRFVLGVTKCSFGMDYMKHYSCRDAESAVDKEQRVVGLMGYDANGTKSLRSLKKEIVLGISIKGPRIGQLVIKKRGILTWQYLNPRQRRAPLQRFLAAPLRLCPIPRRGLADPRP